MHNLRFADEVMGQLNVDEAGLVELLKMGALPRPGNLSDQQKKEFPGYLVAWLQSDIDECKRKLSA